MINQRELEKWKKKLSPYIIDVKIKLAKEEMERRKKMQEAFKC